MRTPKSLLRLSLALAASLALTASALASHPGPLTGELVVDNDRRAAVDLYIDGQPVGEVRGQTKRVIPGVANGVRVVSYSVRGDRYESEQVAVPIGRRAVLRIVARRGTALITNSAGVPVNVTIERDGGDWRPINRERELGRVRPGKRVETPPLPIGAYTLTAVPVGRRGGGPPIVERFVITPSGRTPVTIAPWMASLTVTNTLPHRVEVRIDGERVRRLGSGRSVEVGPLAPGVHEVRLAHRGAVVVSERLTLAPGSRTAWSPAIARFGGLELVNVSRRAVTVRVDGRVIGLLEPNGVRVVPRLPAGDVTVAFSGPGGREVVQIAAVLPDRTTRLELALRGGAVSPPPHAH